MDFDTAVGAWRTARARDHACFPGRLVHPRRRSRPARLLSAVEVAGERPAPCGFIDLWGRRSARSFAAPCIVAGQKALWPEVRRRRVLRARREGPRRSASCARIFTTATRRACTAAPRAPSVIPVLDAGAIRYFDCRELSSAVRRLVRQRQWRFAKSTDPRLVRWAAWASTKTRWLLSAVSG